MDLFTPLTNLKGVGESIGKRLAAIGLNNVNDLLLYFPYRYDDFTRLTKIKDLSPGITANVVGQIELIQNRRAHHRRMFITEALLNDGTETLKIIWFNQPFIAKTLKVGDTVSLAGRAEDQGVLTMVSPIYEKINSGAPIHTSGLVPNYHLTEKITQKQLRFLISQIFGAAAKIPDPLPTEIRRKLNLFSLPEAIKKIHFPKTWAEIDAARRRLAFDELFSLQLKSQFIKKERDLARAEIIEFKEKDTKEFVAGLPFKLTDDQRRAAWEILGDLGKERPMARLLNGDVGSGKTLVAIIALLNVALNNKQGVLMAPTEILAQQHFNTISGLLKNFPLRIALLTNNYRLLNNENEYTHPVSPGATHPSRGGDFSIAHPAAPPKADKAARPPLSRAELIKTIKAGEIDIIIGTHALIQEDVKFKNLALAVIDEQHRFGVEQRKTLMEKSNVTAAKTTPRTAPTPPSKGGESFERRVAKTPHLLSMTATPIPRSLALALFGDLDISIIKQMPVGRKPILTKIVPEEKRAAAYDFIRKQIQAGRQAFVICPLIEESDWFGVKSVKEEFVKLDKAIFPEIKMAALHGRLKPKEKEGIMRGFLTGEYKILVSTSVVEVGVDVPNATIMMIEGADRFGLAQLHQFRGRVGRGADQSYCFLFPASNDEKTKRRLEALEKISDGFALAKMDLKMRGSGEIFGTAQSGFPELKIATLWDYELMKEAQGEAIAILAADPDLKKNPLLREKVNIFDEKIHLE
ncbi:MAG TPA: ATP-dependent DNA helicase RecG [Candidatus Methylomirabilis sp.]|nr:ATP-dependent DNA helicase RecG [Candidatus Methylomirabilis sp.]